MNIVHYEIKNDFTPILEFLSEQPRAYLNNGSEVNVVVNFGDEKETEDFETWILQVNGKRFMNPETMKTSVAIENDNNEKQKLLKKVGLLTEKIAAMEEELTELRRDKGEGTISSLEI